MPPPIQRLPTFALQGVFVRSRSANETGVGLPVVDLAHRQRLTGLNFSQAHDRAQHFRLRPERWSEPGDATPCDYAADFLYIQNGDWMSTEDVIFRLTCSGGAVLGSAVALDVRSNYTDVPMSLPRFTFSETKKTTEIRRQLPRDYTAAIALKFWAGAAHPAMDDWIELEIFVVREGGAVVSAGMATLYPCAVGDKDD